MITLNKQPAEGRDAAPDGSLEIVGDPWFTIQGEGPFAGRVAVFVRTAGCNLCCPSCDTDYTSDRRRWTEEELTKKVVNEASPDGWKNRLVVLTGGEPFRQNIGPFVESLLWCNYEVQIETNGTLHSIHPFPFASPNLTIVCSPKTPGVNDDLKRWIKAYKYVLDADHVSPTDGLPTHTLGNEFGVARPHRGFAGEVYVQPAEPVVTREDTLTEGVRNQQYERNVKAAVESCMKFGYRLSLQLHKIIGVK